MSTSVSLCKGEVLHTFETILGWVSQEADSYEDLRANSLYGGEQKQAPSREQGIETRKGGHGAAVLVEWTTSVDDHAQFWGVSGRH